MCGIFCSFSHQGFLVPDYHTEALLQSRGPDSVSLHQDIIRPDIERKDTGSPQIYASFFSTVLSLRGQSIVEQPLFDAETHSRFCWNGEAWMIDDKIVNGNDSELVFSRLLKACYGMPEVSNRAVIDVLSSIRGPYAFVFHDALNERLYYGRDCLGRRSLLKKTTKDGALIISSVSDDRAGQDWVEVEADGIYIVDIKRAFKNHTFQESLVAPHQTVDQKDDTGLSFVVPFPALNRIIPIKASQTHTQVTEQLRVSLQTSLKLRVRHVREAVQPTLNNGSAYEARIAVLFSGGLDCTILARMCHDLLPLHESIDLFNVAFQNPRIHGHLEQTTNPFELCPDRITGRVSYTELVATCPGRVWRFVAVDVQYCELQQHRNTVVQLMHPHNTEMDLSISWALYFASMGSGKAYVSPNGPCNVYISTAHVLLSGLGADELFGGYQRHATAFARRGYSGLLDELELDFNRLGKRNLGRDDRIISNSKKEVRFPYLDEDFIALALELPVTLKCDFNLPHVEDSPNPEEYLAPEKRALRLLAWQLGMKGVANEKKRAIQFGARTAKMETGKTKGTHVIT